MGAPAAVTLETEVGKLVIAKADGSAKLTMDKTTGAVEVDAPTVTVTGTTSVQLDAPAVTLQAGSALGSFLTSLHTAMTAWVPVPNDGGTALKTALAAWLALTPPS